MNEIKDEIPQYNSAQKPDAGRLKLGSGLIVSIVVVSLLAGALSGFAGGFYAQKYSSRLNSLLADGSMGQNSNKSSNSVGLNPSNQSIVNVVKQASPAVVSITISEQVSNIAQNNPGFDAPFGFGGSFFNFGGSPYSSGSGDGSSGNSGSNSAGTSGSSYQEVAAGSGFFVTSDGLILTNKHVVSDSNAKYTVTTNDGKNYDAKVVATDPINDLALVKISISGAPTLQFDDSSQIQIGEQVIAIGNSLGQYQNTVTSGIVSGIGRTIDASSDEGSSEELDGVIQTDAAINPGNSGGPLLDAVGRVVGVNTAMDQQGELLGFAIPSDYAQRDIQIYQKEGKIIKPFLGISYVEIDQGVQQQYNLSVNSGAYVTASQGASPVVKGSAADKAGIQDGDIITAVDGQAINAENTLAGLLQQYNPGQTITLSIIRNGKSMQLQATLGTTPSS